MQNGNSRPITRNSTLMLSGFPGFFVAGDVHLLHVPPRRFLHPWRTAPSYACASCFGACGNSNWHSGTILYACRDDLATAGTLFAGRFSIPFLLIFCFASGGITEVTQNVSSEIEKKAIGFSWRRPGPPANALDVFRRAFRRH